MFENIFKCMNGISIGIAIHFIQVRFDIKLLYHKLENHN